MEYTDETIISIARSTQETRGWFSIKDIYYGLDVGRQSKSRTPQTSMHFSSVLKKAGAVKLPGSTSGGDAKYAFPDES